VSWYQQPQPQQQQQQHCVDQQKGTHKQGFPAKVYNIASH
jgi:hypothetical protein